MSNASQKIYERTLTRKNQLGKSNYPTRKSIITKIINRNFIDNKKSTTVKKYRIIEK